MPKGEAGGPPPGPDERNRPALWRPGPSCAHAETAFPEDRPEETTRLTGRLLAPVPSDVHGTARKGQIVHELAPVGIQPKIERRNEARDSGPPRRSRQRTCQRSLPENPEGVARANNARHNRRAQVSAVRIRSPERDTAGVRYATIITGRMRFACILGVLCEGAYGWSKGHSGEARLIVNTQPAPPREPDAPAEGSPVTSKREGMPEICKDTGPCRKRMPFAPPTFTAPPHSRASGSSASSHHAETLARDIADCCRDEKMDVVAALPAGGIMRSRGIARLLPARAAFTERVASRVPVRRGCAPPHGRTRTQRRARVHDRRSGAESHGCGAGGAVGVAVTGVGIAAGAGRASASRRLCRSPWVSSVMTRPTARSVGWDVW